MPLPLRSDSREPGLSPAVPWLAALAVSLMTMGGAWWWLEEPSRTELPRIEEGATLVVNRDALSRVDLRTVHQELIPGWVVARGGMKRSHWDRIRREAGKDANLGALLDRMAQLIDAGPVLNAAELLGLVRTWNAYLSAAGRPWRIAGEVVMDSSGGELRLKCYEVLLEGATVRVASQVFPVSIRRRADDTTQVDAWLGHVHSHEEGVVLLLDQVVTFALDRVWPMMDPSLDAEHGSLEGRFAAAIRAEAGQFLGAGEVATLEATAGDRFWLNRAKDLVHARHACGSQFMVSKIPWRGLSPRDLATLELHATSAEGDPCPDVTAEEALVFGARSHHLQQQAKLQQALERLVAWVAAAVAVHEARHAADVAEHGRNGLPCPGCPEGASRVAELEGSAYIASFAHQGTAALSLFQACGLDAVRIPDRAAIVAFLAAQIVDGGCAAGPPPDLMVRAAEVERKTYGRSQTITLDVFPERLPVGLLR